MQSLIFAAVILLLALGGGAFVLGKRKPWTQRWSLMLGAFLIGLLLDLVSKEVAFHYLPEPRDTHRIFSWWSWTHARNKGAAFGMFAGKHTFFMVVTLVAFVAVPYFVNVARERIKLTAVVMGLILAGVAGNFWDRMVFGYVRDFIDWHTPPSGFLYDLTMRFFDTNTWPTFNVADIFITCGAVAAVLFLGQPEEVVVEDKPPEPASSQGPETPAAPA